MSMVVSLIILAAVIILIVIIVAGIKVEAKKGGEETMKNVFIYLVLFATLMMVIGGSVGAFMAVADIVAPVPYHQTFEEFKRWGMEKPYDGKENAEEPEISEEEMQKRYDAMVEAEKFRQVERAKNSLIKSFGWIIIPLPVFLFFQRRLTKNDMQNS